MHRLRGNTLVSLLATIAIIALLAGGMYFGFGSMKSNRKDGKGITYLGASKAAAQDSACRSNLGSIRQSIMATQTLDEGNPPSLDSVPGIKSMIQCPLGKEPYLYDPTTGKVACPHPGHEKY